MPEAITFHIDGREVTASSDQVVLQAASDAGIYIPYLCYHPGMKPYGACRMCVVEVEGAPGTPASCTLPVREGMRVHTGANAALNVRDSILDMLLSEHPHGCLTCHRVDLCGPQDICLRHVDVTDRCVTCPKNERCELKDTTRFHARELNSPLTYQYRGLQVETRDPFYDRDYNLCIVCARCVRACDELRGDLAITMTERSGQVLVGTSRGDSLLESGCEFCGACIDVCPVGALVESDYKWERPTRVEQSICSNCPVGCRITYEVNQWERVVRAVPELNAPANMGQACYKGKFGFKYVNDAQRLKEPLVRQDGRLAPASWDDAIARAAGGLAQYRGPQFGLLVSPRATNEEMYLAQKFARAVMGSNNVDSPSNDRPGLLDGLHDVLGYYAGTGPIQDMKRAACVLVVSANLTEEQNVAALPIKQAVRAGAQQLIVIDAREVELTRYAHLWLRPYPGTDLALLGGILRVLLDEGLEDRQFIAEHCEGLDGLRASLAPFTLDAVAVETGVPADQVQAASRLLAANAPASIVYALDNTPAETHAPASRAIANLALVTGNLGKPGAGIYPLRTGANDQGAWDMGCEPRFLPGYQLVADEAARRRFSMAWGAPVPSEPGLSVRQMIESARHGSLKAMLVIGDHAAYSDGTLGDVAEAFDRLELLVVSDVFLSPLAHRAHVVLPASTFLEKRGTYTNMERRVQPLNQVFQLKTHLSRPDYHILGDIAARMGADGFRRHDPEAVLDEVAGLAPIYAGVSYARLLAEAVETPKPSLDNPLPTQVQYSNNIPMGLQWPCPAPGHPGTPRLFDEGWGGRKAPMGELPWIVAPRHADDRLPFLLIPGRLLAQPEQPIEVVRAGRRNEVQRDELVVVHPDDASRRGLRDGQAARIVDGTGRRIAQGTVRVWDKAHRGTAALTTLFGEMALALDSSEHPDPMNHVPRLSVVPVRVEAV